MISYDEISKNSDIASIFIEQSQIDLNRMRELNKANRLYRKCIFGNCPTQDNTRILQNKERFVSISKKALDSKLTQVWSNKGRKRRLRNLSNEISDLELKIKVATAKPYTKERESDFYAIEERIKSIKTKEDEIEKMKMEINHLKSQIVRLDQKRDELSHETESEDKFQIHLKKANRQNEIFERRVETSKQKESLKTQENRKLCQLIQNMLFDRTVFNHFWKSTVEKLKNRRKFLLDMIERSNQAFNQGAEHLENLKMLKARRTMDQERHIKEMTKIERKIDANEIMNMFLSVKGKYRKLAPLENREIQRRENFKQIYSDRLNLYKNLIENIKKFTGYQNIKDAMDFYVREENEGFQCFAYLNEMNKQIENLTINYVKSQMSINNENDQHLLKLQTYDDRIAKLNEELTIQIERSLHAKDNRDKYEFEIQGFFIGLKEIMDMLKCDYSTLDNLLGSYENISSLNLPIFLSILEKRLNEVLAVVYCSQRVNLDIMSEDEKLIIKSLKRDNPDLVRVEEVITTQQCAECGESEDVNRYDDTIIFPHSKDVLNSNMRNLVMKPEIAFRLHNLSKCNLPRSGIIAGRRFAE